MKAFTNPRPRHYARNRRNVFGPAGHGEPGPQADAPRLATGLPNGNILYFGYCILIGIETNLTQLIRALIDID
ncbi:hypothetical protein ABVK25_005224 [Lepraria finkii]|uniref:Uncharacterized protein n=1 Tax=Lepraria finkii TaxID=1340010 RepID=A0ABR4B9E3_9LECA